MCDSFITIGLDCGEIDPADATTPDPDWSSLLFNSSGQITGGWFNTAPANGQGTPDANGKVLIAQFSVKQNKNTSGTLTVYAKLAGSDDITEYALEAFDCATASPGPGGGTSGSSGGSAPIPSGPEAQGAGAGTIWYVDDDGAPGNRCTTWNDACPDLQTALSLANAGDQVWVAQATNPYLPDGGTGDRNASFQLETGVSIYGGFVGTETMLSERDWLLYETILSGNIGSPVLDTDNSYHVVSAGSDTSSVNETAILDGFTVTKGYANGSPGGVPNGRDQGSAVNIWVNSTPKLVNCTFRQNWSDFHATVNDHGGATLEDCVFRENHSNDWAGGLYVHASIDTIVTNCEFYDNTAANNGGGAYVRSFTTGPEPTFTGCIFSGNSAFLGGGMYCGSGRSPNVTGCTFTGNTTSGDDSQGGGMYNNGSNPTITSCTFSNNISNGGGAGGGMYNAASSPTVSDCTFTGNETTGFGGCGGAMVNDAASDPLVIQCDFRDSVSLYGGGVYNQVNSAPTLINCTFTGNHAEVKGGGMYNSEASAPTLTNCLFSGNSAGDGGGGAIFNNGVDNSTTATHCTFSGNSTTNFIGGGLLLEGGGANTFWNNCIFWGNVRDSDRDQGGPFMDQAAQIALPGTDLLEVTYTDVQACVSLCSDPDDHNIGDLPEHDPDFIDPDGVDEIVGTPDDNLHLLGVSPCIDSANNLEVPPDVADLDSDTDTGERTPLDLDLNPRFIDDPNAPNNGVGDPGPPPIPEMADMGAYEYQGCLAPPECPPDLDGDGDVDPADLAQLLGAWGVNPLHPADFNCDSIVGAFDLAQLLGDWGPCE